jgi:hypothetical protein
MNDQNPFYPEIRNKLELSQLKSLLQLILVSAIFPIVEAFLVNKLAAATSDTATGFTWALVTVVVVHLLVLLPLVWEQIGS